MDKKTWVDNKAIGMRIRKEREVLNLSREKFAEIIGLSDYYVGQLERGERQMSLPVLVKTANCLHISLDYLVFGISEYDNSSNTELNNLLNKCSSKELDLLNQLVKTILPYLDKN